MSRDAAVRRIVALHAPGLLAEILNMRALRYGTDPGSASAIRRHGSRLIVKQDDVNALAVIDASACIMPLLLPPGADGRRSFDDTIGNRHLKMDLEAAVVLPEARVMDVVEPDGCAIALKLEGIEPTAGIEPGARRRGGHGSIPAIRHRWPDPWVTGWPDSRPGLAYDAWLSPGPSTTGGAWKACCKSSCSASSRALRSSCDFEHGTSADCAALARPAFGSVQHRRNPGRCDPRGRGRYRQRLRDLAVHFSSIENRSYVYRLTAAVEI